MTLGKYIRSAAWVVLYTCTLSFTLGFAGVEVAPAVVDFFSHQWWEIATVIGGGVTGIVVVFKKVLIPLWKGVKWVRAFGQTIESKLELLDRIAESVKPNGGGSLRDAVDRVESHFVLHEARSRAILNLSGKAAFEACDDGDYVFVSHEWTVLTGMDYSVAKGTGWLQAIHPDDRDTVREDWQAAVEEQRPFAIHTRFQHRATFETVYVLIEAAPVVKNSKVIAYIGAVKPKSVGREVRHG